MTTEWADHVAPKVNGAGQALRRCAGLPKYSVPAHMAPLADFNKNRARPDGLTSTCKACRRTWRQAHYRHQLPQPPTALQPAQGAVPAPTAATTTPRTIRSALAGLLVALAQRLAGREGAID